MTQPSVSQGHLRTLEKRFGQCPVAELAEMRLVLGTSARTVLRALRRLGYLTSYSHAGRYYTLQRIPTFDSRGLWVYGEARFSSRGTLRATVVVLVKQAVAGYTHEELRQILGLRLHDTLRDLVAAAQIGRAAVDAVFVYVDVEPQHAAAQIAERRKGQMPTTPGEAPPPALDLSRIIDVLVTIIHHPGFDLPRIVADLQSRGLQVSEAQVEQVLVSYGVKKTARSRSRRSRRSEKQPGR